MQLALSTSDLPWLLIPVFACLQDCQAAIDRDPKEAAAWFNKGNAEMRLGDFNSALTSYTYAADAAPGIAGYRLREAQLLFEVRSLHQALTRGPFSCAKAWAHILPVADVMMFSPVGMQRPALPGAACWHLSCAHRVACTARQRKYNLIGC